MNAARSRPDGAAHQAAASRRLISSRSPSSCTPGSHSSTSSDRSRRSLHCPASTPPSRSSSSPRTPMSIRPARSSSWPRATSSTRPGRRSPSSSPAAGSHPHRVRQPETDRQRLDGGIERRDRHLGVHRRADPRSPPPASSTTGQPPPIGHTSTSSKASALSTSTHGGSKTASTSPPPACQPASTAASTSPPGTSAKKPPPSSSEPPSQRPSKPPKGSSSPTNSAMRSGCCGCCTDRTSNPVNGRGPGGSPSRRTPARDGCSSARSSGAACASATFPAVKVAEVMIPSRVPPRHAPSSRPGSRGWSCGHGGRRDHAPTPSDPGPCPRSEPVTAERRHWPTVFTGRVAAEDSAAEGGLVDFVGPVVDAGCAFVAVPVGQDRVVGDAERAVNLDGRVDGVQHRVGDRELDGRDLVTGGLGAVAVDHPGGVEGLEACTADLGVELRGPVLDHLAVGERLAVRRDHRGCWPGRTSCRRSDWRCRASACSGGCARVRGAPGRS